MTAVLPQRLTVETPGVYDLDEAVYHADPVPGGSLSASGAKKLLPPSCPALFAYERNNPPAPKRVFDLGHATHKLVLGSGAELVQIDAFNYKTKSAQEAQQAAHAAGKTPVLTHEMEQAQAMAEAIRKHPDAGALFHPSTGRPEQSLFWIDEPTGIWRRSRLDWLPHRVPGQRLIVPDLKSCVSAAPADIERAVSNFGYHLQAAFYVDGIKACGLDDNPAFVFVFVEKKPPHLITIVQPDRDAMRIGRELAREAINIYRRCTETGHWDGYASGINFVSLPPWAVRQHEENL